MIPTAWRLLASSASDSRHSLHRPSSQCKEEERAREYERGAKKLIPLGITQDDDTDCNEQQQPGTY